MIMKKFKFITGGLLLVMGAIALHSCKKNDNIEIKDVVFTDKVNSYVVTFTNSTTDAKSFRWDFGDGTSSTEQSPVHTYTAKGKFAATLYATLNNGKVISGSTIIHVSKSSPIKLDDHTLADWDTISNVYTSTAKGGIMQKAKFDYDSNNIYIYMEMASSVANGDIFDFYLDTDNDATTGLLTGSIPGGGYDYLLEGQLLLNDLGMYQHTGAQNAFSFNAQSVAEYYQVGTVVEANGIVKFEMSLSRSKIGGLTGKGMKLGVMLTKSDWSKTLGQLPDAGGSAIALDISQ